MLGFVTSLQRAVIYGYHYDRDDSERWASAVGFWHVSMPSPCSDQVLQSCTRGSSKIGLGFRVEGLGVQMEAISDMLKAPRLLYQATHVETILGPFEVQPSS